MAEPEVSRRGGLDVSEVDALREQNVHLRSLIRRFANSWSVTGDVEGRWWWKPDPHVDRMRRERFTVDEETAYLAVCNEIGVTWPI